MRKATTQYSHCQAHTNVDRGQRVDVFISIPTSTQHLNQPQPDPAPPRRLTKTVLSKWPCRHPSLIDLKTHKPDMKSIHNPTCLFQIQSWVFQCLASKSLANPNQSLVENHLHTTLFIFRKWNKVNNVEREFKETI